MNSHNSDNRQAIPELLRDSFEADFEWLMLSVDNIVEDLTPADDRATNILPKLMDTIESAPADMMADTTMLRERLDDAKFDELFLYRLISLGRSFFPETAAQFVEKLNGDLRCAVAAIR